MHTGKLYAIMCASKKFSASQQRWSATQRELYALMWGMKKFRYYLAGRHFTAVVDHQPLLAMLENPLTLVTERWLDTLLQFDFTTSYKPGSTNNLADALSRMYEDGDVVHVHMTDVEHTAPEYQIPSEELKKQLLTQTHLLGHFGAQMCAKMVRAQGYNWPDIERDFLKEVENCTPCMKFNVVQRGYNPLHSIIAEFPWDHVEIDLVGPLIPSAEGHSFFLTYVDVMSGFTLLRPLKKKDMSSVTEALWHIFAEYGPLKIIQSDNGLEFVNQLLSQLLQMLGIEQRLVSPYHPRANGLVERTNKEAERLLKKILQSDHAHWEKYLPAVQMSLNLRIQERTGSSPFSIMTGRPFNRFQDFSNVKEPEDIEKAIDEHTKHHKALQEIIYPALLQRTQNYKHAKETVFNKSHKIVTAPFKEGDIVYAEVNDCSSKWDEVYKGPFEIAKVHGEGRAYTLKDMSGQELETRFVTSKLKKGLTSSTPGKGEESTVPVLSLSSATSEMVASDAHTRLPLHQKHSSEMIDLEERPRKRQAKEKEKPDSQGVLYRVDEIVDDRVRNGKVEYLVKWHGYSSKDNTWEPAESFTDSRTLKNYWQGRTKAKVGKRGTHE